MRQRLQLRWRWQSSCCRWRRRQRQAFAREIRYVLELQHAHLVRTHGICQDARGRRGELALVMERCERNLAAAIYQDDGAAGLTLIQRQSIMRQSLQALVFLHAQQMPIWHGDLKPQNILLVRGEVRLADFGLAGIARESRAAFAQQSTTGVLGLAGSIHYMAPELLTAPPRRGLPADVYAWAITMCELFAGEKAWPPDMDANQITAQLQRGLVPPVPDAVPAPVRALLRRCVLARPEQRPSAARRSLHWRRHSPISLPPPLPVQQPPPVLQQLLSLLPWSAPHAWRSFRLELAVCCVRPLAAPLATSRAVGAWAGWWIGRWIPCGCSASAAASDVRSTWKGVQRRHSAWRPSLLWVRQTWSDDTSPAFAMDSRRNCGCETTCKRDSNRRPQLHLQLHLQLVLYASRRRRRVPPRVRLARLPERRVSTRVQSLVTMPASWTTTSTGACSRGWRTSSKSLARARRRRWRRTCARCSSRSERTCSIARAETGRATVSASGSTIYRQGQWHRRPPLCAKPHPHLLFIEGSRL